MVIDLYMNTCRNPEVRNGLCHSTLPAAPETASDASRWWPSDPCCAPLEQIGWGRLYSRALLAGHSARQHAGFRDRRHLLPPPGAAVGSPRGCVRKLHLPPGERLGHQVRC